MPVIARKWMSFEKAAGLLRQMIVSDSHDPIILDKAAALIRGLNPMNYTAEAQALWAYVRGHVRYVEDPYNDDHFQSAAVTLNRMAGDCDDQAVLLGTLLRSIGFPVRLCFVFKTPPRNYQVDFPDHVYLEVDVTKGLEGEPLWIAAETIPLPGDRGGFYMSTFGANMPKGYREYVLVN